MPKRNAFSTVFILIQLSSSWLEKFLFCQWSVLFLPTWCGHLLWKLVTSEKVNLAVHGPPCPPSSLRETTMVISVCFVFNFHKAFICDSFLSNTVLWSFWKKKRKGQHHYSILYLGTQRYVSYCYVVMYIPWGGSSTQEDFISESRIRPVLRTWTLGENQCQSRKMVLYKEWVTESLWS